MSKTIMGIELRERVENAPKVQELFTKYGCYINTRLGLHSASKDSCSPRGLIILEFIDGADREAEALEKELSDFEVNIQKMKF
ncbi:MAG: hypothetical protein Q8878_04870 [Bacillota bacterium]|nr:hypothetical protein [Bacillota bacterium]